MKCLKSVHELLKKLSADIWEIYCDVSFNRDQLADILEAESEKEVEQIKKPKKKFKERVVDKDVIPCFYMNTKEFEERFLLCSKCTILKLIRVHNVPYAYCKSNGKSRSHIYFDPYEFIRLVYISKNGGTYHAMIRMRQVLPELEEILSTLDLSIQEQ